MKKLKGVKVNPESLQEMLDRFNNHKKMMRPDMYGEKEWSYQIDLDRPNGRGGIDRIRETFQLSAARAMQQFAKTMKGPFASFEKQLAHAISRSKQSGCPLFVLVHGGITKNKLFEDRVHTIASSLEFEDMPNRLIFTAALSGIRHRSCHLAMGASQLAVDAQTFQDFLRGGAAWGLQIRQHHDNPSKQWNNVAAFIPFKEGEKEKRKPGRKVQSYIDVMAGDRLKLVVDPLYNVKHPPSSSSSSSSAAGKYVNCPAEYKGNPGDMLDTQTCCYDLYTFEAEQPKNDWFRLRMSAEQSPSSPDTAHLVVERSCWRWDAHGRQQRGPRYGYYQKWLTLTVTYDSGSRLWLQVEGSAVEHAPRTVHAAAQTKRKAQATTTTSTRQFRSGRSSKRLKRAGGTSSALWSRSSSSDPEPDDDETESDLASDGDEPYSSSDSPPYSSKGRQYQQQHQQQHQQKEKPLLIQLGPATRPPPSAHTRPRFSFRSGSSALASVALAQATSTTPSPPRELQRTAYPGNQQWHQRQQERQQHPGSKLELNSEQQQQQEVGTAASSTEFAENEDIGSISFWPSLL